MSAINLTAEPTQIRANTGATIALRLRLRNKDGTPYDPTGATITAPFVPRNEVVVPIPAWTVTMDVTPTAASAIISLTAAQSSQLGEGYTNAPVTWDFVVWLVEPARSLPIFRGGLQLTAP